MSAVRSGRTGGRHRSPYGSRSRSRSPTLSKRMAHRLSSSREHYRSALSPRDRRPQVYDVAVRDRSASPKPYLSSSLLPDKRLQKPEVEPSVCYLPDFQTDSGRFLSSHVNPPPITLSERFTRITASGTAVYNRRLPGRSFDTRRIPQLIIANNTQLPPATLFRQAKSISVVVERKFPRGKKRSVDDEPHSPSFRIPRRSSEGLKPVFDRPEIKFYRSAADEALIAKRLLDCIAPTGRSRQADSAALSKPQYDVIAIAPSRFYGCRVDDSGSGSRYSHPLDPLETPRNPAYFMHDTRDDTDLTSRRNWRTRFPNSTAGYRRDFRDRRSPGSPERPHTQRADSLRTFGGDRWQHDKFEQLEYEEGKSEPQQMAAKPVPKPVPAPKPILWSTIGKEISNGEVVKRRSDPSDAYTPADALSSDLGPDNRRHSSKSSNAGANAQNSSTTSQEKWHRSLHPLDDSEDVRIDAEPVLDETMDET
ncbi:hypothetical protein PHET_05579 [Paragonimus heterotremus]|uniref:Btz domain-containing protein n=1 Tax=Paragonimus heterotremus TaxID=100268 RepID=A0A8J4WGC0_9TREM|nr:hypothetical protein PHET_05579 [Paragonimus heterotremus]